MPTFLDSRVSDQDIVSFVLSFVEESADMRSEFEPLWDQTLSNYLVNPYGDSYTPDKDFPLSMSPYGYPPQSHDSFSILADSESHQIVESWLATTMLMLYSEPGYIQARRVGLEDTFGASTVTRLLEYDLSLEGVFRTLYQWKKDGFIFGTGVIRALWEAVSGIITQRQVDSFGGVELDSFTRIEGFTFDDPLPRNVDILDFFPDPGKPRIHQMLGCAERFTITGRAAKAMVGDGSYGWDREAVSRALSRRMADNRHEYAGSRGDDTSFEGKDRPRRRTHHPDFLPLIGIDYWGEVPWNPPKTTDDPHGDKWRRVTLLNGELVSDKPWPLSIRRLPFHEFCVNPLGSRFYGVGPLETSRFEQDFANMLKMNLADAAVRMTHPMPIVDSNKIGADVDKFMSYRPSQPIMAEGDPSSAAFYLPYNPNIGAALSVLDYSKRSMQARSAATEYMQTGEFGTKRQTGTESTLTAQRAQARPELVAVLAERESLPGLGKSLFALNQQFLDTDGLNLRVGRLPAPVSIQELLFDYDFRFVGSRQQHNKASRLQALERAAQAIGQLPVAARFPWGLFMSQYLRDLDLPELEVAVDAPEEMLLNLVLQMQQRGQGGPAQNAVPREPTAPGLLPAQAAGQMNL